MNKTTKSSRLKCRPVVFVSASVYDKKDLLEQIFVLLQNMKYDVRMSYKGTIPVSWEKSAFENCEDAVDSADIFLGIISPCYGSGVDAETGISITEREMCRARDKRIPRIMLVDERVMFMRRFLTALGYAKKDGRRRFRELLDAGLPGEKERLGAAFLAARNVCDLRTLDLYDEMVLGYPASENVVLDQRVGNWIQECGDIAEYRRFIATQFSYLQKPEVYTGTADAVLRIKEKLDAVQLGVEFGGSK